MIEELKGYSLLSINHIPYQLSLIACIVFCVGTLLILRIKGFQRGWQYSIALLLAELLLLIYGSTVFFRETKVRINEDFHPFRNYLSIQMYMESLAESLLNLILFVPVGILLCAVFRNMVWWKVLLVGACLSMGIEVLQFILEKGLCDFNDLLSNTLGCMLGYSIFRLIISSGINPYKNTFSLLKTFIENRV